MRSHLGSPSKKFAVAGLLLLGLHCSVLAATKQKVVVRGSDAMLYLASRWSQMMVISGSEFSLDVNGGGPSAGVSLLASGKSDVAQLPRKLTEKEKSLLRGSVLELPVAIESVVIYTNSANPVAQLTIGQLKDIYTGKITNWKQVGGRDAAISLYSTESLVGGSLFFREVVLGTEEFDTVMQGLTNTKAMLKALAKDPNGIGFGDLDSEPSTKHIKVSRGSNFPSFEPSTSTLRTTDYPLSRYLYWIVLKNNRPGVTRVCDWVLSQQGQLVVEATGYYPLNAEDRARATGLLHPSR
jgi:phosphate transport system substrate-binding protein